jgi:hypothetical protein
MCFLRKNSLSPKTHFSELSIRAVSFERSIYGSMENFSCWLSLKKGVPTEIFPTKPGHFSRTLSKGPNTTTWIWNLHADAHDFDSHTSDLEEISRKVFSAHFGQLGVIFIWLSGCETSL